LKVGVYICHCGKNIASIIDVEKVVEEISKVTHVSIVKHYPFMCSELGQKLIIDDLRGGRVDRVVVAACSPRMHEDTFRKALEEAGVNPYLLEIANIREQCSWVHYDDPENATLKAIDLIKAAIARVVNYKPIEKITFPVHKEVLVIGGGIAGIRASLDLAKAGFKVYLVEREPSIGGQMAKLDKTFPTLDCSLCILTPLMNEVARHENITLLTYSEVIDISGRAGDFKVKVVKKPRYVQEDKCISCGDCAKICPVKVPDEFNYGLSYRKAIYRPFAQSIPSAYVIDPKHCLYLTKGVCQLCARACKVGAINYEMKEEIIELNVGAIIIATGYQLYDIRKLSEYGYGRYKNVIHGMEFERISAADGPTKGKIVRPSDGKTPEVVAIILCAGSRDESHLPYCCKVGCMVGLKHAYYIASSLPNSRIYLFYTDIRAAGKGFEEFYQRIRSLENVYLIKGKPMEIREEDGKLVFDVFDITANELYRFTVDLVILESGLIPNQNVKPLTSMLKLPLSQDGFLLELHPKLKPVETAINGVFICGCAQGLKDIPDTVAQASASAAAAISLLAKGEVEAEPFTVEIDEELCSGCGICVASCPYNALKIDPDKRVAEVDVAACRGCGTCVAACPTSAITQKQFTDKAIVEAVKALLS